ncbi:MAG: 5-formyltetrahydrofolate cyclo-ligase [Actinomycetota bacterium]
MSVAAKEELRARMRRARAGLPPAERLTAARRIEDLVLGLPAVNGARTVLMFYSFGSEVPTSGIAERLLAGGGRVLLPFLEADAMEAAEVRPGESLVHTSYGPKEPARRVAVDPATVDAVVTPGLAFDRRGRRLGYGGGHYDRYLARLRTETPRVGVGFALQVIDHVPADPLDQLVDLVVTEGGVIECSPPRLRTDPPA